VAGRVLPTERARAEIDELFASDQPLGGWCSVAGSSVTG